MRSEVSSSSPKETSTLPRKRGSPNARTAHTNAHKRATSPALSSSSVVFDNVLPFLNRLRDDGIHAYPEQEATKRMNLITNTPPDNRINLPQDAPMRTSIALSPASLQRDFDELYAHARTLARTSDSHPSSEYNQNASSHHSSEHLQNKGYMPFISSQCGSSPVFTTSTHFPQALTHTSQDMVPATSLSSSPLPENGFSPGIPLPPVPVAPRPSFPSHPHDNITSSSSSCSSSPSSSTSCYSATPQVLLSELPTALTRQQSSILRSQISTESSPSVNPQQPLETPQEQTHDKFSGTVSIQEDLKFPEVSPYPEMPLVPDVASLLAECVAEVAATMSLGRVEVSPYDENTRMHTPAAPPTTLIAAVRAPTTALSAGNVITPSTSSPPSPSLQPSSTSLPSAVPVLGPAPASALTSTHISVPTPDSATVAAALPIPVSGAESVSASIPRSEPVSVASGEAAPTRREVAEEASQLQHTLLLTRLARAEAAAQRANEYQTQLFSLKNALSLKNEEISKIQVELTDVREKLLAEQHQNSRLLQENQALREYIDGNIQNVQEECEKLRNKAEFQDFRYKEMESRLKSDIRVLVRKVSQMRAREVEKEQILKEKEKSLQDREKALEFPLLHQLQLQLHSQQRFSNNSNDVPQNNSSATRKHDDNCNNGRCGTCSLCLHIQVQRLEEKLRDKEEKIREEKDKVRDEKQKRKKMEKQVMLAEQQVDEEKTRTAQIRAQVAALEAHIDAERTRLREKEKTYMKDCKKLQEKLLERERAWDEERRRWREEREKQRQLQQAEREKEKEKHKERERHLSTVHPSTHSASPSLPHPPAFPSVPTQMFAGNTGLDMCCNVGKAIYTIAQALTLVNIPKSLENTPIFQAYTYLSEFLRKNRTVTPSSGVQFPRNPSSFPFFPFSSSFSPSLLPVPLSCCPACSPILPALLTFITGLVGAVAERDDALAQWVRHGEELTIEIQNGRQKHDDDTRKLAALTSDHTSLREKCKNLTKSLETAKNSASATTLELKELQTELKTLQKAHYSVTHERDALLVQHKRLYRAYRSLSLECEGLQARLTLSLQELQRVECEAEVVAAQASPATLRAIVRAREVLSGVDEVREEGEGDRVGQANGQARGESTGKREHWWEVKGMRAKDERDEKGNRSENDQQHYPISRNFRPDSLNNDFFPKTPNPNSRHLLGNSPQILSSLCGRDVFQAAPARNNDSRNNISETYDFRVTNDTERSPEHRPTGVRQVSERTTKGNDSGSGNVSGVGGGNAAGSGAGVGYGAGMGEDARVGVDREHSNIGDVRPSAKYLLALYEQQAPVSICPSTDASTTMHSNTVATAPTYSDTDTPVPIQLNTGTSVHMHSNSVASTLPPTPVPVSIPVLADATEHVNGRPSTALVRVPAPAPMPPLASRPAPVRSASAVRVAASPSTAAAWPSVAGQQRTQSIDIEPPTQSHQQPQAIQLQQKQPQRSRQYPPHSQQRQQYQSQQSLPHHRQGEHLPSSCSPLAPPTSTPSHHSHTPSSTHSTPYSLDPTASMHNMPDTTTSAHSTPNTRNTNTSTTYTLDTHTHACTRTHTSALTSSPTHATCSSRAASSRAVLSKAATGSSSRASTTAPTNTMSTAPSLGADSVSGISSGAYSRDMTASPSLPPSSFSSQGANSPLMKDRESDDGGHSPSLQPSSYSSLSHPPHTQNQESKTRKKSIISAPISGKPPTAATTGSDHATTTTPESLSIPAPILASIVDTAMTNPAKAQQKKPEPTVLATDMATLAQLTHTPLPPKKKIGNIPRTLPIVRTLHSELGFARMDRERKARVCDEMYDDDNE